MEDVYISIHTLIAHAEQYYAHTKEIGHETVYESLEAHTLLCQKYFDTLINAKEVDAIFLGFQKEFMPELQKDARRLFDELWHQVIVFHDVGKANPFYQRDRLRNNKIKVNPAYLPAGSRHSGISAVLYMDYFLQKVKKLEVKEDRKKITLIVMLHAFMISRHHSDLNKFEDYLRSLVDGTDQKILSIFAENKPEEYLWEFDIDPAKMRNKVNPILKQLAGLNIKQSIYLFGYWKMLYSLLVASDYYATSEFSGNVKVENVGNISNIEEIKDIYNNTKRSQSIRYYKETQYPQSEKALLDVGEINILRNELYLEVEEQLLKNLDQDIYYLEAPTGSGKSNIALNLDIWLTDKIDHLKKTFYVYPFNTLIEQNLDNLYQVFEDAPKVKEQISVINSITPIKILSEEKKEEEDEKHSDYYQKALLNRQFLNDPIILTTHLSIFDTLFGDTKESVFGFHQLANSILVLDEIQSYKNIIWCEIISFLKQLASLLHMKIIIMSATLPDLDLLAENMESSCRLIQNREKYFAHPKFRQRVVCDFELLEETCNLEKILNHVGAQTGKCKRILVEFIKKRSADDFYQRAIEKWGETETVLYLSGEDSLVERKKILNIVKSPSKRGVILVATQVIEAGVDIDMDIGYKNIAKLDCDEQFMGRVNRSAKGFGKVYFFKLDDARQIYGEDVRVRNKEFTLENGEMRDILIEKEFGVYYQKVLQVLKQNYGEDEGDKGVKSFFEDKVAKLNFPGIKERMKLIEEDHWHMQVYLARVLYDEQGEKIDGAELWKEYKELLTDNEMSYAKKRVKLSYVTSKMNCFIYQIKKNMDLIIDDYVGELFYIENGEKYFENGKLNRRKIQGEIGEFVDFI